MQASRRSFLTGIAGIITAGIGPGIIRTSGLLMPIKPGIERLPPGIYNYFIQDAAYAFRVTKLHMDIASGEGKSHFHSIILAS